MMGNFISDLDLNISELSSIRHALSRKQLHKSIGDAQKINQTSNINSVNEPNNLHKNKRHQHQTVECQHDHQGNIIYITYDTNNDGFVDLAISYYYGDDGQLQESQRTYFVEGVVDYVTKAKFHAGVLDSINMVSVK